MTEATEVGQQLTELVREHRSRLVNYAARWTRTRHDAEDAVQNALVVALERIADVRPDSPVGWLIGITRRCAQAQGHGYGRTVAAGDTIEWVAAAELQEGHTNGGRCMADEQTAGYVRRVLDELTPRQREALHLWAVEGLEWAEVAARMGVAVSTARHAGYTSLRRLRDR